MKGYEDQFIRLQNACQAQTEAAEKERDQAWEQFRDREQQLDQVRTELQVAKEQARTLRAELAEAKQYGAEMAMKAGEMEKLAVVRLYNRLHRQ